MDMVTLLFLEGGHDGQQDQVLGVPNVKLELVNVDDEAADA